MHPSRVCFALLPLLLLTSGTVLAQECSVEKQPGLERYQRQLFLDLLGRPPAVEEYESTAAKGRIDVEEIRALMERDEFYDRMRGYHRALLRSNIVAVVNNDNDSSLTGTGDAGRPFAMTDNNTSALRGRTQEPCDPQVMQAEGATYSQDPHAEQGLVKQPYDSEGVPLPLSWDYSQDFYSCRNLADAGNPASCELALDGGRIPERYRYFCDMKRQANGTYRPFLCLPDPGKFPSSVFTTEEEEADGGGHVVAFLPDAGAGPVPGFMRLDRCSVNLTYLRGNYSTQVGCIQREGMERVPAPYWEVNPRPAVLACAIEAQDRAANPYTQVSCQSRFTIDRTCGCEAKFNRCESSSRAQVHNLRIGAFNGEPERIADSVLRRNEPYFNLLTTRRSFANGPIAALYRERQGNRIFTISDPVERDAIPALTFTETDTWREYLRGEQHSGVLTTPSWLLRFPTQRARVNEFYAAFLCKSFDPPEGSSLPDPEDSCNRENNLAKRCGCNYCHATIEPTGAHWGRFGERSAEYLAPAAFPRFSPVCQDCALSGGCPAECNNYVTAAYDGDGAADLGKLKTYLYRTEPEEVNIEAGPQLLVQRMLQTGELERCAVQRIWTEFLGRPMSTGEKALYLEDLSSAFLRSGHNLKALIEHVVTTDAYRRID